MDPRLPRPRDAAQGVVAEALAQLGGDFGIVLEAWTHAVGPDVVRFTVPTKLRAGELWIRCSSSSWAHELQLSQGEYLARLNAVLARRPGSPHVTSLRALSGGFTRDQATPQPPPAPPLTPSTPTTKAHAHDLAQTLPPGRLRDRVEAAIEASTRRASMT